MLQPPRQAARAYFLRPVGVVPVSVASAGVVAVVLAAAGVVLPLCQNQDCSGQSLWYLNQVGERLVVCNELGTRRLCHDMDSAFL